MSVDPNELLALPLSEKLRLIELLWEDLGQSSETIPIPDWVEQEATRRRDEMLRDSTLGITHEEAWKRILCEVP
ncbi:MAG: addiction module protein [Pirellulaceae bacterium]